MKIRNFKLSVFKNTFFIFMTLILIIVNFPLQAQDINARSPKPSAGSHQQQVADKKKLKQQQQIAKNTEKGVKRHLKLQTKNTRKMIKKSKRSSKHWNDNKKEFFLKRWFRKNHH